MLARPAINLFNLEPSLPAKLSKPSCSKQPTSCLSTNSRFRTRTTKFRSQPNSLQWRPQEKNALVPANRHKEWRRLGSRWSTLAQWSIRSTFRYWVWMFTCFTNVLSTFSFFKEFGPKFVKLRLGYVHWVLFGNWLNGSPWLNNLGLKFEEHLLKFLRMSRMFMKL